MEEDKHKRNAQKRKRKKIHPPDGKTISSDASLHSLIHYTNLARLRHTDWTQNGFNIQDKKM